MERSMEHNVIESSLEFLACISYSFFRFKALFLSSVCTSTLENGLVHDLFSSDLDEDPYMCVAKTP